MGAASSIRSRRAAMSLLAVAGLVAGLAACTGGDAGTDEVDPGGSPSGTAADGAVTVVDQGFSTGEDGGEPTVSYGVVLENTSTTQVAYIVQVSVTLLDKDGKAVDDTVSGNGGTLTRDVRAILPGQQGALGNSTYVDRDGTTEMLVEVGTVQWMPMTGGGTDFAELTATDVRTEWDGGNLTVGFTVNSAYPEALDAVWGEAVLRNPAGEIVGGLHPGSTQPGSHASGTSPGEMRASGPLPAEDAVDGGKTTVFLYP